MEETTFRSDVTFAEVVNSVHDRRSTRSGDTVVVGFSNTANRSDWGIGFEEVVLGEICFEQGGRE